MIQRCTNPKHRDYKRYGGRGISVCERWLTFSNFLADMGEKPKGATIERRDNDGRYEKRNCRWAGGIDQANNKSNNRVLQYDGKRMTLAQWSRELGIPQATLSDRLQRGYPVHRVLAAVSHKETLVTINGKTRKLGDWWKVLKMNSSTYYYRIKQGLTPEEALTRPVR